MTSAPARGPRTSSSEQRTRANVRAGCGSALRLALAALALAAGTIAPRGAAAQDEAGFATLEVRVDPPVALSFDDTVIGRARHAVTIEVRNPSAARVALSDVVFRFVPIKDGMVFACKTDLGEADRWPKTLDPGERVVAKRGMQCETPLVGRYDVQVRVRRATPAERRGSDGPSTRSNDGPSGSGERIIASFPLVIEPGTNPPKTVPWDKRLLAAATATKDRRPADPPPKVIVGYVNASTQPIALSAAKATLHVKRRGGTDAPCEDQIAELPFRGELAPGQTVTLPTTLTCPMQDEGIYEIATSLSDGKTAVAVADLAVRVSVIPTPVPMMRRDGPLRPDPHP